MRGRALLEIQGLPLGDGAFFCSFQEKSESYIEKGDGPALDRRDPIPDEKVHAAAYQAYQQSLRLNPITNGALGLEFKSAVALVYLKNYPSAIDKFKELEKKGL